MDFNYSTLYTAIPVKFYRIIRDWKNNEPPVVIGELREITSD
jgi:hypothetical protein